MPLSVIWLDEARDDLNEIVAYIAERDTRAADKLGDRIVSLVEGIPAHPYMFRSGRVAGTREAVAHPNYIVIYRVEVDAIVITAVIHARRQYPPDSQ